MNKKEKNTYKNAFQVYCSCPKNIPLLCIFDMYCMLKGKMKRKLMKNGGKYEY